MPKTKTSPGVARGTRTAVQGGAGLLLAEFVDTVIYDMPGAGVIILAAILGGLVSWLQVTVEDAIGKAFLREIPEPDAPVTDQANPPQRILGKAAAAPIKRPKKDELGNAVVILLAVIAVVLTLMLVGVGVNLRG